MASDIKSLERQQFLTRKDISRVLEVSYYVVCANERNWGIDKAKSCFNSRVIRYHTDVVVQQLRRRGIWPG